MTLIITKILIFITVLLSFIFPAELNGATVADITEADGVISYTVKNETGLVIAGDTWVEKLEIKVPVINEWADCLASDEAAEVESYINPSADYTDSYDAIYLLPGTYRITVGYNVVTDFDGTTQVGYATAEFVVG